MAYDGRLLSGVTVLIAVVEAGTEHPRDLLDHECIDYQDPVTGRPFEWELRRAGEVVPVRQPARLMVSDVDTMLDACCEGAGIAQVMSLGSKHLIEGGKLVELFPEWPDEIFPLYAIYPSRQHCAAKVRVFTDFCLQLLGASTSRGPERPSTHRRYGQIGHLRRTPVKNPG